MDSRSDIARRAHQALHPRTQRITFLGLGNQTLTHTRLGKMPPLQHPDGNRKYERTSLTGQEHRRKSHHSTRPIPSRAQNKAPNRCCDRAHGLCPSAWNSAQQGGADARNGPTKPEFSMRCPTTYIKSLLGRQACQTVEPMTKQTILEEPTIGLEPPVAAMSKTRSHDMHPKKKMILNNFQIHIRPLTMLEDAKKTQHIYTTFSIQIE